MIDLVSLKGSTRSLFKYLFGNNTYDENGKRFSGYYVDENGNKFVLKTTIELIPYDENVHKNLSYAGKIKNG